MTLERRKLHKVILIAKLDLHTRADNAREMEQWGKPV